MKVFLLLISLLITIPAQAGLGSLLVGMMVGAASQNSAPVVKSDMQIQIDNISKSLPHLCKADLTVYGSCWSQFKKETQTYQVGNQGEEIKNYFQNRGYQVSLTENSLIFDFKSEHAKYLVHQTKFISMEAMGLFVFLAIPVLWYLRIRSNYRKRVLKIKALYEKDPEQLFFWDKSYKGEFEEALAKTTLPLYWNVNLENNQIGNISYYNGRSIGRVASPRESIKNTFKALGK